MADDVTFTVAADATPPGGTVAATDETTSGPHSAGAQMGIAKLAVSANGDSTHAPLTLADGLLVNLGANNDVTITGGAVTTDGLTDAELRATPVPVSGTVTANAGTNLNTSALALEAGGNLAAIAASASVLDDWDETDRAKVNPIAGQAGVQGASGTVTALTQRVVLATDVGLPAGTANIGDVDIASLPNEGQQTMANSISVALASDQTSVPTKEARSATGTQTSVADNAASVTLLAANAARVKALITNDSSARLYVLFNGSAASTTAYGVSLAQFETWEELNYTGEIRGIWATDPGDGAARITEFT